MYHFKPTVVIVNKPEICRELSTGIKNIVPSASLTFMENGRPLLDYLNNYGDYQNAPKPCLVITELELPDIAGRFLLKEIKLNSENKFIPVIVLSSKNNQDEITEAYNNYANAYVTIPESPEELIRIGEGIARFWLTVITLPAEYYY